MSDYKVLRKVENLDAGTAEYCADHERKMDYINHGFVDANWPRAAAYSRAIRDATVGFAIADERGVVQREFKTLAAADKAAASAKTTFSVEIEDEEEEPAAPPVNTGKTTKDKVAV